MAQEFRKMRKEERKGLPLETAKEILKSTRIGILAVNGDNGYPYAVPINYLYDEESGKIYFHGSKAGHKIAAIKACDKICFTVYGDEVVKDENEAWAPYVQSVVAFGRCHLIEDHEEAMKVIMPFAMKYYPTEELALEEIELDGKATQMFVIEIEHMTAKQIQEK